MSTRRATGKASHRRTAPAIQSWLGGLRDLLSRPRRARLKAYEAAGVSVASVRFVVSAAQMVSATSSSQVAECTNNSPTSSEGSRAINSRCWHVTYQGYPELQDPCLAATTKRESSRSTRLAPEPHQYPLSHSKPSSPRPSRPASCHEQQKLFTRNQHDPVGRRHNGSPLGVLAGHLQPQ